jgi:hypothetical protein
MPSSIDVDTEFPVGEACVLSKSPDGNVGAVFEDDGDTGYFYAVQLVRGKPGPILDAVHIYNVANITDRHIPSRLQIVWSHDSRAAALVINRYPHAIFDFVQRRACCRTGFPPPSESWGASHDWDDTMLGLFR